ncbi:hypothetical protein CSC62_13580 [Pseudoxanthomonas jiangsuensis]|uniref:alpha/beta hydrolase family protein n=1 Tax=Pseudoxanthomonas jiangsuensis TaxID=619688 RepID=UPI0013908782|nr:alpha/beta fold hydrolase [Pseudoxanthomonas jiangsuensis]KAF1692935.1 hypothetical protein CSC62_13580 [Pseudoxanthomonas jiangsuensis]
MSLQADDREAVAADGHRWTLLGRRPERPRAQLLWLPALGVSARNYLPLAEALAARGVATWVHEWRGNGGSSLRPSRDCDWGYRELLSLDLPASLAVLGEGGPRTIGGHSLGGQLACCFAGQHPQAIDGLCLVASGTPYWRSFPGPRGWLLPAVYRFLPWLARRRGVLPGRRLGFGGTEARGLIADWARVGLSNRYAAAGMDADLDADMGRIRAPVHALVLADDWLAPRGSMQALLARMPQAPARIEVMDADRLQAAADHFAWMKRPAAVAEALAEDFSISSPGTIDDRPRLAHTSAP